jgi:hypothetical protein
MSGGGAVVAIVAAQHARRVRDVMDAFRPGRRDRARARARSLRARRDARLRGRAAGGAGDPRPGPGAGTWYLSEAAVVARRDRLPPKALRVVLAVLVGLLVVLLGVLLSRNAQ